VVEESDSDDEIESMDSEEMDRYRLDPLAKRLSTGSLQSVERKAKPIPAY